MDFMDYGTLSAMSTVFQSMSNLWEDGISLPKRPRTPYSRMPIRSIPERSHEESNALIDKMCNGFEDTPPSKRIKLVSQVNDLLPRKTWEKEGSKIEHAKKEALSLIQSFAPEQIRQHISSLGNKSRQISTSLVDENTCQLCWQKKIYFCPDPINCSSCHVRIKHGVNYYGPSNEYDSHHCFCTSCHGKIRGVVCGTTISKASLKKTKNNQVTEEPWVQCNKCELWQHQICALFNDQLDVDGEAEFTCALCCLREMEAHERIPLPKSTFVCAKDLPKSKLSDHIEHRLVTSLKDEREMTAKAKGLSLHEVPAADHLIVRMVSNVEKELQANKQFRDFFPDKNYPSEFRYRAKVILLFQKIDEVDVCIFSMYVQEFGSECSPPDKRCFYISYLDSVNYFRPNRITSTGEALRTFVYHEIMIAYLDYMQKRGFVDGFIWSCPPISQEDYILYCHPQNQKLPKPNKLRKWYQSMLKKAANEKIVVEVSNLYDRFFLPTGDFNTKITATRLPYFDGDYWSSTAEILIEQIELDNRKGSSSKRKKQITKRTLWAMGHSDASDNTTKDILLMEELGHVILPAKENFLVVRLQFVCKTCNEVILSRSRWFCKQCKNFQLCQRCHDAEKKGKSRGYHIVSGEIKHVLFKELMNELPSDTDDKDVN